MARTAGLTVAMAAGCLYCARDLWVRETLRAWILVALMNLTMIAVHALHRPRITTAVVSPPLRRHTFVADRR
jgi:hypothetical protein